MTIRQVAELAGVSPSAVSHAFNGRKDISDATRNRIMAAAAELNWRPAASAQALTGARTRTIGYVVLRDPDRVRSDPFFVDVVAGVQRVFVPAHYDLLVHIAANQSEELDTYQDLCQSHRVDGFLLIDHKLDDPRYSIIAASGIAAVALGKPRGECSFPTVASEPSDLGLSEALQTLRKLGHRRIAYVGGPRQFAHSFFRRKRLEELAAEGAQSLVVSEDNISNSDSAKVTRELLSVDDRPTAVIYSNDLLALGGMASAKELGLRVPEDVSIIGHDDAPFAAVVTPSLASVHEDVPKLADAAAQTLLSVVEHRPMPELKAPITRFVERDSIGPARVSR